MQAAANLWQEHMRCLRPREIPVSLKTALVYLCYSDAGGEGARVGVALWYPDGIPVGGYVVVPQMPSGSILSIMMRLIK